MTQLRVGVIGGGHLGRIHAKLLSQIDGVRVVAVCDPHPAARQQSHQQFGVETHADYRACIDGIDAAVIAAPTPDHAEIAKTLLKAGKHLFVEKPLASDATDAQRLAMLADARRLTLQVGHVERFNPAFTSLDDLGVDVKYVEAVRASRFPGRCLDVGVVLDLMIHDLDLVLSMTDAAVTSVAASGLAVVTDHEDLAEARIEFACGLVANLKASRISPQPCREMRLFGSRGFAELDFSQPALSVLRPCDTIADRSFELGRETDSPTAYADQLFAQRLRCQQFELAPRNAILDELHDWVISIQTGIAPTVDGAAGARAVMVAEQVLQAIERRRWYADASPSEIGPAAIAREGIESASRRAHRTRRAA